MTITGVLLRSYRRYDPCMKLSVSLPDEDVAFIDEYAMQAGVSSRSAVMQRAIAALRAQRLEQDYEEAFAEWEASGEAALWEATLTDGMQDLPDESPKWKRAARAGDA